METTVKNIGPETLKKYLHDGKEIALLDAREEAVFDSRHLFMASCVPLSRMEMLAGVLVPRRDTRVVWCDDGEGLAPCGFADGGVRVHGCLCIGWGRVRLADSQLSGL